MNMIELLGWVLLAVGIGGFGIGGYLDLRYTEFPDWLPYSMIVLALIARGAFSIFTQEFSFIIDSVFVGLAFLGFGLVLYFIRQWGDGDAWMLGALGFMFPDPAGFSPAAASAMPFPLTVFFNFFIISLFYLIGYAIVLGLRSPRVCTTFMKNLRGSVRSIAFVFFGLMAVAVSFTVYLGRLLSVSFSSFFNILAMPFLAVLILLFFHYARAVEGDLFKRKIKASRLRVGDVLVSDRWRGLTEKEVKDLRKKGKDVWIKEGVRFAPVFIICLLVTLLYGSLWALMFPPI
ncbi:MAG: prepilin peptidase [Candidatus Aenigmarchaeota archaeon]|nr:prepilin peptidase [Candidatus Aenigmarchaeota archaeon]